MNGTNTAFVIGQASDDRHDDKFAKAVRESIEVGVVVPSILRSKLEAAGFAIVSGKTSLAEYGFGATQVLKRVLVSDKDGIVAMGASSDEDDALLHATLGWFREHPLEGADVPPGLVDAPAP